MDIGRGHCTGRFTRGVWVPDAGESQFLLVFDEVDWKNAKQDAQRIIQAMMDGNSTAAALMFAELLRTFPAEWKHHSERDYSVEPEEYVRHYLSRPGAKKSDYE